MTQISTSEINIVPKVIKSKNDRFMPYIDTAKAAKLIRKHHVGNFLAAFAVSPQDWYNFQNELQKLNLRYSRLKIPILYGNDHVHGANYVKGATLFPQPINLASTFNLKYAEAMGRVTANDIGDLGQQWNFAPILDIGRNPYWPRQYETFGEDSWLVTTMGTAYIKALQEGKEASPWKIAATAKHFMGYSDPKSGWDRAPSVIPEQELREFFLPPFRAAVKSGVKTFMVNSGEVNGVPVHASKYLLTDVLRKELGFNGVVVTDWADILQLIGQHRIAHNEIEATRMALEAGIDMSMTASSTSFCDVVKELVNKRGLPMSVVDSATIRILRLKFDLGLFEYPYPRADRFARIGNAKDKATALDATRESLVLLKNDSNLLPLAVGKKVLLLGPQIANRRNLAGGWTLAWGGGEEAAFPATMPTLMQAFKDKLGAASLDTQTLAGAEGTALHRSLSDKIAKADVVVLALGEEPYAEGLGNINNLNLPEEQLALVKAVQAAGKPHIVVMIAGRPRLLAGMEKGVTAFVHAGLPGEFAAQAITELLKGDFNPSGKLAMTYPNNVGHITPYNVKVHDKYTYQWAFGHGLSFTQYQYTDLNLSDSALGEGGTIKASVTVTNTGKREGQEAVLWFLKDEVRKLTPSHKNLRFAEKVSLKPSESKTLSFTINPIADLSYPDERGTAQLEMGWFELSVGGLKRRFFLRGKGADKIDDFKLKGYLQEQIGTE